MASARALLPECAVDQLAATQMAANARRVLEAKPTSRCLDHNSAHTPSCSAFLRREPRPSARGTPNTPNARPSGAARASMPPTTLTDVLSGDDHAPALLAGTGDLPWREYRRGQLRRLAQRFAATLRASGLQPGDVVTIAEPNTVNSGACRLQAVG